MLPQAQIAPTKHSELVMSKWTRFHGQLFFPIAHNHVLSENIMCWWMTGLKNTLSILDHV